MLVPVLKKIDFTPVTYLERQLPVPGELRVKIGDEVKPFTTVGEALLGLREEKVNAGQFLGVKGGEVERYLTKGVGEGFAANEILAKKRGRFGLGLKVLTAPFNGVLKKIDKEKGEIYLSTVPERFSLTAGGPGKVVNLIEGRAVLLQVSAVQVRGVWASGGTAEGELTVLSSFDEALELSKIVANLKGKIVVGGSFVSPEVLRKAAAVGVRGVVCGGANVLPEDFFAGSPFCLLLTEGFGVIPMLESTWRYLKSVEARTAILLSERQSLLVPEKLPPQEGKEEKAFRELALRDQVQIFAWPYFGRVGVVIGLAGEKVFPSGVSAPAVLVNLPNEREPVEIPLRNVGVLV